MIHSVFSVPPQVEALVGREREVALLVYERGRCTAKDFETLLTPPIPTNGAIRSMLVRLTRKGVLKRHWGGRGRSREFLYVPAITPVHVRQGAIQQMAQEHFDGSIVDVILEAVQLLRSDGETRIPIEHLIVRTGDMTVAVEAARAPS